MVISIVTRKTSVKDRAQWQSRLEAALPAILAVLKAERGFAGVEYLWGAQDDGTMGQVTRWQTLGDCLRYVRGGGGGGLVARRLPPVPPGEGGDGGADDGDDQQPPAGAGAEGGEQATDGDHQAEDRRQRPEQHAEHRPAPDERFLPPRCVLASVGHRASG